MFAANPQPQGNANIGQNVNNNDPNDEAMIFPDLSSEGVTGESTTSSPSPAPLILGGGTAGPISGFGSTPALARGSSQAESFRSDPSEIIAATPLSQRAAPIAFGLASGTSSFQAPISLTAFDDTVVNSPVAIPTVESEPELEPEPGPEPEPEPEPPVEASAQPDVGSVTIGQTLTQQTGILVNDEGDGKTLTTVNGVAVASSGQTTIVGKYGTLNIQADGTYTYDAINIDIHSDLAAHWTFDDTVGSTQAHDVSNVDRFTDTGTLHNNAAIVSGGVSGNALQLDGTGDYVSVPRSSELAAPQDGVIEARTISLSFRPTSLGGIQALYSEAGENSGFNIAIENRILVAGTYSSEPGVGDVLARILTDNDLNQWHNITLSLDETAGTLEAWFDGTSLGVRTNIQSINTGSSRDIELGRTADDFYFDGMIDEVRVYNRALNQQEVDALLAGTNPMTETFDYTIQDSSGGTSSSTLDITVTAPANIAPIANDDFLSVTSDQGIYYNTIFDQALLGNDGDPDGNTLTITHVGDTELPPSEVTAITGQFGTLLISPGGTYAYAPFGSSSSGGVDAFIYTVSDGTATATASLTITVIPDGFTNEDNIAVTESPFSAGSVYVIDGEEGTDYLAVVDVDTGVTYRLGEVTGTIGSGNTIGMGPDGTLYGADNTNLYTINPATQTTTVIGAHGIVDNQLTGIAVAPDGTIYGVAGDGHIFSIDASTGMATNLGTAGQTNFYGVPLEFEGDFGDLIWHDGALYTLAYTQVYVLINPGNNQQTATYGAQDAYQIIRIEPSSDDLVLMPAPHTFNGGLLHGLTSVNGELKGIMRSSNTNDANEIVTIDATTGLISEYASVAGTTEIEGAASQGAVTSGNLLSNDIGAESVTTVALPDGHSVTVSNDGATLQGIYGTLTVRSDGSYIYSIDNSLEATNNLNSGKTGNDRFIYTATDQSGATSQSIITVLVSGANEIQVTDQALFTSYTLIDSVDVSSTSIPIDFTITTQNSGDKITQIQISGVEGSRFNVPSILTDSGTITSNSEEDSVFTWKATPGPDAGLDSFDAVSAGLTLASINKDSAVGQRMAVSATVSEYSADGSLTDSWVSTSAISLTLVAVDTTLTGISADGTLTGSSEVGNEIDKIIGGAGNDLLTGGTGTDFFVWRAEDVGDAATPAIDTITDFTAGPRGDVLDLRDLLPDSASNTLDEFLSFSFAGGDTTISASLSAGGPVVQNVVLTGVDLSSTYGTTDVIQLTNQLTNDGNLLV